MNKNYRGTKSHTLLKSNFLQNWWHRPAALAASKKSEIVSPSNLYIPAFKMAEQISDGSLGGGSCSSTNSSNIQGPNESFS